MPTTLDQMLMDLRRRRQQQLDAIMQGANASRTQPLGMAPTPASGGTGMKLLGNAAANAGFLKSSFSGMSMPDFGIGSGQTPIPGAPSLNPSIMPSWGSGIAQPGASMLGGGAAAAGAAGAASALTPVGTATGEGIAALLPLLAIA